MSKLFQDGYLSSPPTSNAKEEEYEPNLNVIQVTNVYFRNTVSYHTNRLVNNSQRYNGKLSSRRGKYLKRLESVMNLCVFDERIPITILRFLDPLKGACNLKGVLEAMARWVLPRLIKEGPRGIYNNLIVPIGFRGDAYARPRADNDKICTYVEDVSHLLETNATNANFAKATSETRMLEKMPNESAVQSVDTVRIKTVRHGKAYPEEWTREISIDGPPTAIASEVRVF